MKGDKDECDDTYARHDSAEREAAGGPVPPANDDRATDTVQPDDVPVSNPEPGTERAATQQRTGSVQGTCKEEIIRIALEILCRAKYEAEMGRKPVCKMVPAYRKIRVEPETETEYTFHWSAHETL